MSTNPFAPPRAPTADIEAPAPARVRKPVSAWLMQIVAALGITAVTAVIAMTVSRTLMHEHIRWVAVFTHLAIDVALMAWFTSVFIGTQNRKPYGRRLGLALIGAMFLLFVWVIVQLQLEDARRGLTVSYAAGELVGSSIWLLLCGWWWHAFGHSKAARTWFGRPATTSAPAGS